MNELGTFKLLFLREFRKDLGLWTCAASRNNEFVRIDWEYVFLNPCLFFLTVWLMPFVYEVSKFCSRIFDIWSKLVLNIFQKVKKSDQGCPGRSTSVQGDTPPRGSEKTVRKKNAQTRDWFKQLAPKWEPLFESLAYLG